MAGVKNKSLYYFQTFREVSPNNLQIALFFENGLFSHKICKLFVNPK